MKIKLKNISPEEALKSIGFKSANRGFILKRKLETCTEENHPLQIHALIDLDKTIELHADYLDKQIGKHISSKRDIRLGVFRRLLKEKDDGIRFPKINSKFHNKYEFKWGALMVNGKRK